MEDAHGTALTKPPPPRRRWWPARRTIVAWLAAFPAAWGAFAAFDWFLPEGPAIPECMLAMALGVPLLLSCCGAPLVGVVLLFYAMLRYADARERLYTAPVFVVCFVAAFCRDVPVEIGLNGVLATVAAAALVTAEALVRRLRQELITASCLLAVATLEVLWCFGLWIATGI